MTEHIEAKKGEIAKTVIMPGDPLRAKMIASKFLTDCKLVNTVRGIFAYTGYFNNKLVDLTSYLCYIIKRVSNYSLAFMPD